MNVQRSPEENRERIAHARISNIDLCEQPAGRADLGPGFERRRHRPVFAGREGVDGRGAVAQWDDREGRIPQPHRRLRQDAPRQGPGDRPDVEPVRQHQVRIRRGQDAGCDHQLLGGHRRGRDVQQPARRGVGRGVRARRALDAPGFQREQSEQHRRGVSPGHPPRVRPRPRPDPRARPPRRRRPSRVGRGCPPRVLRDAHQRELGLGHHPDPGDEAL